MQQKYINYFSQYYNQQLINKIIYFFIFPFFIFHLVFILGLINVILLFYIKAIPNLDIIMVILKMN